MSNLTVLYYTANRLTRHFATAVRRELIRSLPPECPIVVVSQNGTLHSDLDISADFTNRIHTFIAVEAPPSIVQVYKNILAACEAAKTEYCASAEDDTLYVPEHWTYRPDAHTFAYNAHRFVLTRRLSDDGKRREAFYYTRPRTQMAMGIFARQLMIEALQEKFARYPAPPLDTTVAKKAGWGEPGRYEANLKLTHRTLARVRWTLQPNVTINHSASLMGRRRVNADDIICYDINPWGKADELWRRIVG